VTLAADGGQQRMAAPGSSIAALFAPPMAAYLASIGGAGSVIFSASVWRQQKRAKARGIGVAAAASETLAACIGSASVSGGKRHRRRRHRRLLEHINAGMAAHAASSSTLARSAAQRLNMAWTSRNGKQSNGGFWCGVAAWHGRRTADVNRAVKIGGVKSRRNDLCLARLPRRLLLRMKRLCCCNMPALPSAYRWLPSAMPFFACAHACQYRLRGVAPATTASTATTCRCRC